MINIIVQGLFLVDGKSYCIKGKLQNHNEANDNKLLKERRKYLSNYENMPHVKVVIKRDKNGNPIRRDDGKQQLQFIGFDGKEKKFSEFSEEEVKDWEKQNLFAGVGLEYSINKLSNRNDGDER